MTTNMKGIIWDLDGTLYRDDNPVMDEAYEIAGAKAALDLGVPLSLDEARLLARASYMEGGTYIQAFAEPFGIDHGQYHFSYHSNIDEAIINVPAGILDGFQKLRINNHALVTHGSRDWAERVIRHLGLKEYFPSDHIIAFEDYDFNRKSSSQIAFAKGLKVLKTLPVQTFVVEDTASNLEIPYNMGMRTIHIDHGRSLSPKPDYIDYQSPTIIDVLDGIAKLTIQ